MNHINTIKFISVKILFLIVLLLLLKGGKRVIEVDGGVVKNTRLKGYSEKIKSKEITSFEYKGFGNYFICKLEDNKLNIKSKGGNTQQRDGTYFKLDYESKDKKLLNKLKEIIEKNNISQDNGYEYEVAGLPEGLGDYILVTYKSGEKIWKYSNQNTVIGDKAKNEIYNAFKNNAKENNLDFNSKSSNTHLYDDTTIEYLQGSWEGTHFGKKYKVTFEDTNIKIYEDEKLTDDTKYTIIDGNIVKDELKEKDKTPKDRYDYKEFNTISALSKKNDFILVAYFLKDSYSSCELIKK